MVEAAAEAELLPLEADLSQLKETVELAEETREMEEVAFTKIALTHLSVLMPVTQEL
jgi:hypothetical protein